MIRALLLSPLLVLGSAACDAQAPASGVQARGLVSADKAATSLPALTGRIVDRADILDRAAEAELDARLAALEKRTTDQMVVVTVPGLEGGSIEELGRRLGNSWGIGRKTLNNGVLLIVAPEDRRARIEVGKGLEGLLTDERAQRIMDERIVPPCREGHCDRGIAEGVEAIAALLSADPKRPRPKRGAP